MNKPTDEEISSWLVGIISDGFNRSMLALEKAGAIDRTKMNKHYCGVGSKYYDLVTEQMEYTARYASPVLRQLFCEAVPASSGNTAPQATPRALRRNVRKPIAICSTLSCCASAQVIAILFGGIQ